MADLKLKLAAAGGRQPEAAGYAAIGTSCAGNVLFSYRGNSYRRIDAALVKWWGRLCRVLTWLRHKLKYADRKCNRCGVLRGHCDPCYCEIGRAHV